MEIKRRKKLNLNFLLKRKFLSKILLSVLFVLFTISIFVIGGFSYKQGYMSNLKNSLNFSTPINFVKGKIPRTVETIIIDIKFKNFLKIQKERNEALIKKVLKSDEYVPAKVSYAGKKVKVNIRLKGDLLDHLEGKKWSYRIKTKGDNTIFGMKQFSIHHPKTRNYIYEWAFHKSLKKEGLVALRYKFIKVILNGEDLGIYAVEEHFEKRLIENNNKKAGPIIRFNEDLYWESILSSNRDGVTPLHDYNGVFSSNIDAFKSNQIMNDSLEFKNFTKAISLLESFRSGEKSTSEVFDIDLLSTYYAMIDLYGANHGLSWTGLRYYFNPISSYLEPIGFDAVAGFPINNIVANIENSINSNATGIKDYMSLIFDDQEFNKLYIKKLTKFSSKSYLDSLFSELENELNDNLTILYSEWPFIKLDKNMLYDNQKVIRQFLNPPKAVQAYTSFKDDNNIQLSISNIQTLPIKIESLTVNDSVKINTDKIVILKGKKFNKKVSYTNIDFIIPEKIILSDSIPLKINYSITGTNKTKLVNVFPWNNFEKSFVENDYIRKIDNTSNFNFIKSYEDSIVFKKGTYKISEDIHINANSKVILNEGTTIDLINNSSIISKSPFFMKGTREAPVKITSSDSTGQGLFILKAGSKSELNNVIFENLSAPKKNSWSLTGAITFYESDVQINNCLFHNNIIGDDYLNIVRSDFDITNSNFTNVNADAFDSDFSTGYMKKVVFENIGNDGIDVSGTKLEIYKVTMTRVSDKGISSGEKSNIIADVVDINNSEIAICCKDNSTILISNCNINSNTIGITAFQKKPEFGPANIIATNTQINNTTNPFLIETGSKLLLDGKEIKSNNEKVKDLLYGVIYGKSSK